VTGGLFIGVDVGTGSARAGVFDAKGTLLGVGKQDIRLWREAGDVAEQSSDDIWRAVCASTRTALQEAGAAPGDIAGIGFDAACSMVVLDGQMAPLSVSSGGDRARNVIVWMDHRAVAQAARINRMGHPVLAYVGGVISPEMQTPKLCWLQETLPERFAQAGQFFDLADFLTWKASGDLARSACTVTCKWTYLAHEARWDSSYFQAVGLGALAAEGFARIGPKVVAPGSALGQGLTSQAAADMGLLPGIPVGAGLIDAHAGGVGTVGAAPEQAMAYVFGTSACTMASSPEPKFIPGVWGPYFDAMVPGLWLSEGGQSAAGAAIEHILSMHPATPEAREIAARQNMALPDFLAVEVAKRAPEGADVLALAGERIVVPDFNGNRAPFADPHAMGIIAGVTLDRSLDDLVGFYCAGLLGIGYGLRQILEAQQAHGVSPREVVISGGAGEAEIVKQILADAAGIEVCDTGCPEPVLLGAAMLGARASGAVQDLRAAMSAMTVPGARFFPREGQAHAKNMRRFAALQAVMRDPKD